MSTNVTRRDFLKWSAGSVALMAAAACSPAAPSSSTGGGSAAGGSAANEPRSLNVAQWGTAQRADLYKQALALFQQNNQGVTTNLQFADLSSYNDRLTTQAASKSLPDVLWMRDDRIGIYGSSNALLDLTPFLNKNISTSSLSSTAVADGKVGNGVYALPSHYVGQAVIVNSPYLQDKGVKYEEQVKTWDDLAALARQLTDQSRKVWGINDPTLDTTQRHLQAFIRQAGQELFAADGSLGFTADTLGTWLDFWDKLRKDNIIPPADVQTQAVAGGMATNTIVTGQTAIILASSNGLTQVQRLTQTPLAMFSIPEVAGGSKDWWFFPPILLSVAANTKSPQLAASLVEFFVNSVAAGKITRVDQGAPSSAAVRDALVPDLAAPEAAFVQQISREMTYPARPLPVLPQASAAVINAQIEAGQQVAFGRQSVSQAVDAFMAAAKKATGK
jgi:pectin-derived oligosaccharide transport system substrate-binding protein